MPIAQELLDDLHARRERIMAGGGQDKLEARRKKGLLTARDRLEALFEPGTMLETYMHARHGCHNFGLEKKDCQPTA